MASTFLDPTVQTAGHVLMSLCQKGFAIVKVFPFKVFVFKIRLLGKFNASSDSAEPQHGVSLARHFAGQQWGQEVKKPKQQQRNAGLQDSEF